MWHCFVLHAANSCRLEVGSCAGAGAVAWEACWNVFLASCVLASASLFCPGQVTDRAWPVAGFSGVLPDEADS